MSLYGGRIALLVGIQDYQELGSLKTPHQDVKLMRRILTQCGFPDERIFMLTDKAQPVSASDLRRAFVRLQEGLEAMATPAGPHSCALFYFPGHGVMHLGESYLLSSLASMTPSDIVAEGLSLEEIIRHFSVRLDIPKLLFIDACRSPSRARGLESQPLRLPGFQAGDMLLDLSSGIGEAAHDGDQHSPYACALSRALVVQDMSILDALIEARAEVRRETGFRQSPQGVTSLSTRLVMSPGPIEQSRVAALAAVTAIGGIIPRRNFTCEEIAASGHLIHKLRAKDTTGQWAYYFVLVEPLFEADFMAAIESDGVIDLSNYGVVIASSYGPEPTEDVCHYLADVYGFNVDPNRIGISASTMK